MIDVMLLCLLSHKGAVGFQGKITDGGDLCGIGQHEQQLVSAKVGGDNAGGLFSTMTGEGADEQQ